MVDDVSITSAENSFVAVYAVVRFSLQGARWVAPSVEGRMSVAAHDFSGAQRQDTLEVILKPMRLLFPPMRLLLKPKRLLSLARLAPFRVLARCKLVRHWSPRASYMVVLQRLLLAGSKA